MATFSPHQIANLVGQTGGDHGQAAQMLQGVGGIDPSQPDHADMLDQLGIDPQALRQGDYQEHLDAQEAPGFAGYQPGQDLSGQQAQFSPDDLL
ncbi:hypothetical protein [Streptacidiphilus rugosus]|uniref:hypothetical protein n=1 Tax=Streptacidiphilus rugosus TaxID=405783 RepID=UPI000566D589|nr:hypothetical protein [Streptacidiphilus rugosus]